MKYLIKKLSDSVRQSSRNLISVYENDEQAISKYYIDIRNEILDKIKSELSLNAQDILYCFTEDYIFIYLIFEDKIVEYQLKQEAFWKEHNGEKDWFIYKDLVAREQGFGDPYVIWNMLADNFKQVLKDGKNISKSDLISIFEIYNPSVSKVLYRIYVNNESVINNKRNLFVEDDLNYADSKYYVEIRNLILDNIKSVFGCNFEDILYCITEDQDIIIFLILKNKAIQLYGDSEHWEKDDKNLNWFVYKQFKARRHEYIDPLVVWQILKDRFSSGEEIAMKDMIDYFDSYSSMNSRKLEEKYNGNI